MEDYFNNLSKVCKTVNVFHEKKICRIVLKILPVRLLRMWENVRLCWLKKSTPIILGSEWKSTFDLNPPVAALCIYTVNKLYFATDIIYLSYRN